MRFAPIPPTSLLDEFSNTFHLCLAHVLSTDNAQMRYYERRAVDMDDYVILDNGAYELGASFDFAHVIEIAKRIRPEEIVLPDVFLDGPNTLKEASKGYALLQKVHELRYSNLMVAPQGKTTEEWMTCLDGLVQVIQPDVIGIPVVYERMMGRGVLINEVVKYFGHGHYQPDIHLLGWDGDLYKLKCYAKDYWFIRGIDSAKPFYYAMGDLPCLVSSGRRPQRPQDYFDIPRELFLTTVLQKNLDLVYAAAEGRLE